MSESVDRPTDGRTDGRTSARWVYYKLSLWACGSGELNQATVNNNRTTALERSVMNYGLGDGGKRILQRQSRPQFQ